MTTHYDGKQIIASNLVLPQYNGDDKKEKKYI